jgi:hypothetical protein
MIDPGYVDPKISIVPPFGRVSNEIATGPEGFTDCGPVAANVAYTSVTPPLPAGPVSP